MSRISFAFVRSFLWIFIGLFVAGKVFATDAEIRKNISERLPNFPVIDEITKIDIPGLFELRVGADVFYTDEKGDYLIRGHVIDTKTRTNLTENRIAKLNAIIYSTLPLKDAVKWQEGNGTRKVVVFADPNCGYCKKLELELKDIKNITVYTFLYPILGSESHEKSRNIWCAKDRSKVWLDWMLRGKNPKPIVGECDSSALERNIAMGKKHKIEGTPGIVFEDGKLVAGAMQRDKLEEHLVASMRKN